MAGPLRAGVWRSRPSLSFTWPIGQLTASLKASALDADADDEAKAARPPDDEAVALAEECSCAAATADSLSWYQFNTIVLL